MEWREPRVAGLTYLGHGEAVSARKQKAGDQLVGECPNLARSPGQVNARGVATRRLAVDDVASPIPRSEVTVRECLEVTAIVPCRHQHHLPSIAETDGGTGESQTQA